MKMKSGMGFGHKKEERSSKSVVVAAPMILRISADITIAVIIDMASSIMWANTILKPVGTCG